MKHDEMIAVLTHHKNGGKVQWRTHYSNTWHDFHDGVKLTWNFSICDFRVKPEPLVLWIVTDSCNRVIHADKSKHYGDDLSVRCRKFVEVME